MALASSQGCCWMHRSTHTQRIIPPQMSAVPRWRDPAWVLSPICLAQHFIPSTWLGAWHKTKALQQASTEYRWDKPALLSACSPKSFLLCQQALSTLSIFIAQGWSFPLLICHWPYFWAADNVWSEWVTFFSHFSAISVCQNWHICGFVSTFLRNEIKG